MSWCSDIAIAILVLIYISDDHWTAADPVSFFSFVFIIMMSRITTDTSSKGEKIFYVLFLATLCLVAFIVNAMLDHECTICIINFPGK